VGTPSSATASTARSPKPTGHSQAAPHGKQFSRGNPCILQHRHRTSCPGALLQSAGTRQVIPSLLNHRSRGPVLLPDTSHPAGHACQTPDPLGNACLHRETVRQRPTGREGQRLLMELPTHDILGAGNIQPGRFLPYISTRCGICPWSKLAGLWRQGAISFHPSQHCSFSSHQYPIDLLLSAAALNDRCQGCHS
jgi:hypothetical protein